METNLRFFSSRGAKNVIFAPAALFPFGTRKHSDYTAKAPLLQEQLGANYHCTKKGHALPELPFLI